MDRAIIDYSVEGGVLTLRLIFVPRPLRGRGAGEAALVGMCRLADERGLSIVLTPDDCFGSSAARLRAWYSRHGFAPIGGGRMRRQAAVRVPG